MKLTEAQIQANAQEIIQQAYDRAFHSRAFKACTYLAHVSLVIDPRFSNE